MPCHHPKNRPNQPSTQRTRLTRESDLNLIIFDARKPTDANQTATTNVHEIRSIHEALNVPIAKESREKPHSTSLHGSLPSGLPSQCEFRGHVTPNKVRRFVIHLPAT
jgi:hypothetical protein